MTCVNTLLSWIGGGVCITFDVAPTRIGQGSGLKPGHMLRSRLKEGCEGIHRIEKTGRYRSGTGATTD